MSPLAFTDPAVERAIVDAVVDDYVAMYPKHSAVALGCLLIQHGLCWCEIKHRILPMIDKEMSNAVAC